ncbi:hypothetical protein [Kordia sp.]|uniref:hypothetical protein n=1 Tax=Kordia sp. TaxID=1965332 RepID=UPI003D2DD2A7
MKKSKKSKKTKKKQKKSIIIKNNQLDINIENMLYDKGLMPQKVNNGVMSGIKQILATTHEIYEKRNVCCGEPYYTIVASRKSPIQHAPDGAIISEEVISPVVVPYRLNGHEFAGLSIVAFAKTGGPLSKDKLKFRYNFTLSDTGDAQLNIYISFDYNNSIKTPDFWFNAFNLRLGCKQMQGVDLNEIITAKVFLIDTDPSTTRGTVTTVKNPTSGS